MDTGVTNDRISNMITNVISFNAEALGILPREKGLLSEKELEYAMKATKEEAYELKEAHEMKDFIGAVDAVLDQLYFNVGFLYRMGLTAQEIERCFQAVHDCNMQKKLGVQAKRGGEGVADAVKPEGWVGPEERIMEILGEI
jgi:predicted HAD superfamily Cof-like phosphohydrolase